MDKNYFLKKRYKVFYFFGWKLFFFLREETGIAKVYSKESIAKKVVFIHIPKAAGSSVGELVFGTDIIGHYPYFVYESYNSKYYEEFYKFTVVRDPVERFISAYNFVVSGGKGPADERCGKYIRERSQDINEFVMEYLDERFIYSWVHFVPQTYFIYDKNDKCMIDKVLHLENIEKEFSSIKDEVGVEGELPFSNRKKGSGSIGGSLSEVAVAKIRKIYSRDYSLLGY